MGRPGITREEVMETADALVAEGLKPSHKLIRDRIGGSYTTITPYLTEWRAARGSEAVGSVPEMPERVVSACRAVWGAAWAAAQEALRSEREGLAAVREDLDRERAELTQEIADLEARLEAAWSEREALADKVREAEAAREMARAEAVNLRMDNVRLEERAAHTERRAEELRGQVERLERALGRLAPRLSHGDAGGDDHPVDRTP